MSVLKINRSESRLEVIIFAVSLRDKLIDFANKNFGVIDYGHLMRTKYSTAGRESEDYARYVYILDGAKCRIDQMTSTVILKLRAARSISPTSLAEYEQRRAYQDAAIAACSGLLGELQGIIDRFNVDVNVYETYNKAINREIDLIKKWRQSDNKIKSYLRRDI